MNQDYPQAFVRHLEELNRRDPGAIAALRHSLAFEPGDDPKALRHVERFVPRELHGSDPRRKALYAVAGLYAFHPVSGSKPLAVVYGQWMREKDRPSLELRFIALLDADPEGVVNHLRQIVSLLRADGKGYDHATLLTDLGWLLDDRIGSEPRDRVRRHWARQFYGAATVDDRETDTAAVAADQ